jgi:hypothetical protein
MMLQLLERAPRLHLHAAQGQAGGGTAAYFPAFNGLLC